MATGRGWGRMDVLKNGGRVEPDRERETGRKEENGAKVQQDKDSFLQTGEEI